MPKIFDMLGWAEAAPGTGAVPVAAGLQETIVRINADADGLLMGPEHKWLIGLFAASCATLERVMVRQTGLNNDHEFIRNQLHADNDPNQGYTDRFGVPLPIVPGENLWCYIDNAGDEDVIVGMMIGGGALRTQAREQLSATEQIIGIGDTSTTALTWGTVPITWNQTPKKGRYAILAMRAGCYGRLCGGLARLLVPGMLDWRPGVPMAIMEADHEEYQSVTFEPYNIWGQLNTPKGVYSFTDDQMPNIQVLCIDGEVTDQNVELLIRRIGDR